MAIGDDLKNIKEGLKETNDAGTELRAIFRDIGGALKGLARDSQDFSSSIKDASSTQTDLANSAKELAKFTKEDLKDAKRIKDFKSKAVGLDKTRAALESKIRVLKSQQVNATKKEKAILDKVVENLQNSSQAAQETADGFNDILKSAKEIERANPFKGIAEVVADIPIIGKAFKEFSNAAEAFNNEMAESGDKLKASLSAFKQLGGLAVKATVGALVAGFTRLDNKSTDLSRSLNLSKTASEDLALSANEYAKNIEGATGTNIIKAQLEFADAFGTTAALSGETANNFDVITSKLGLSVEQATAFTSLSIAFGKNTKESTEGLIAQVQIQNALTDSAIDYKDVLQDVASSNKSILASSGGSADELAKAAFEAKKFGLTLNQTEAIGGNLLDFESSIAAEMEAELLTGKQLNLGKARQAALDNDLATLASEIAKEAGSLEEFQNMNRIQQQAIAKAVGMTREELAGSLLEQEAISKLGVETAKEAKAETKRLLDKIDSLKAEGKIGEAEEARKKLIGQLGSDELIRQRENRNTQEKIAELVDKIYAIFEKFVPSADKLDGIFSNLSANASLIAGSIAAIAAVSLVGKFSKLLKLFKGLTKSAKVFSKLIPGIGAGKTVTQAVMKEGGKKLSGAAAQSAVKAGSATAIKSGSKAIAKTGAKSVGKNLLKKIPGIGLIAGLAFAASKLADGDFVGAGLEVASGAASLIPGAGTAASLAIDAGIMARDIKKAGTPTATPMATGGIVNRATSAIVGEAGPEAVVPLNEFYKKIDELIVAVRSGGDIYLDGQKVGNTLSSNYRTISN
tara:strand:- start:219 stop:2624 length:2406 start_codon:yes stop_codon:yes gene_type:complete